MSDDDLYRAYLSGDSEAGDQLMLRHGDALTAYLDAFLHNAQDAEDLMLDCFTVILVDKPKIEDGHFHAYLFRVARNKAVRLWRLKRKRGEFSLDEALLAQGGSPEEIVWRSERDRAVHRCLNRIAPQYREALWLIFDGRLSYAQAAEVLRCNTKKVDNLLTCGKKQLRKELEREGIVGEDF